MTQPKRDFDPPLSEVLKEDVLPARHLWYCDYCSKQTATEWDEVNGLLVCSLCQSVYEMHLVRQ